MPIEALKRRIKTTEDLREIVNNMKMLSSVSIGQYEQANTVLDKYRRNIRDAFHALIINHGIPNINKQAIIKNKYLYVLIGSDNGMIGRFNKEIIEAVNKDMKQRHIAKQDIIFMILGKRLAMMSEQTGWNLWTCYGMVNSVKAVAGLAGSVILKIDEATRKEHVTNVSVWFHQRKNNSTVNLEKRDIIPFAVERLQKLKAQKWETNNIPMLPVEPQKMFAALVKEMLMSALSKLINSSLAAEHYTRMTNMQNAEKNIDENLAIMNLEYQQQRQEEITDELIDVISGAEAMRK